MLGVRGLVLGFGVFAALACGGESTNDFEDSGGGGSSTQGGTAGTSGGAGGSGGSSGSAGTGTGGSNSVGGAAQGGSSLGGSAGTSGAVTGGSAGSAGSTPTGGSGGTPGCAPQRVAGEGACDAAFGVFFLGDRCGWVSGCRCVGEDCEAGYDSEEACEAAHRPCLEGCMPQDATFIGLCEPLPRLVFTGVECVEMLGCECVGEDCERTYQPELSGPRSCRLSNERCFTATRSCEELAATYEEYASRNACETAEDCVVNIGHCGVGIGGCYHLMNRQWPADGLRALAEDWQAARCVSGVCSCAVPPENVACVNGACVAAER